MKLSAVRSPVSTGPAEPVRRTTATPGTTAVPSGTSTSKRSAGSSSRNTSRATSEPAMTPGSLATIEARAPTVGPSVLSVVTSPLPTSSDSAHFTSGSATASSMSAAPSEPVAAARRASGTPPASGRRAPARPRHGAVVASADPERAGGRERRAHLVDAVAQAGGALEVERARGLEHLGLEPPEQRVRALVAHRAQQ